MPTPRSPVNQPPGRSANLPPQADKWTRIHQNESSALKSVRPYDFKRDQYPPFDEPTLAKSETLLKDISAFANASSSDRGVHPHRC